MKTSSHRLQKTLLVAQLLALTLIHLASAQTYCYCSTTGGSTGACSIFDNEGPYVDGQATTCSLATCTVPERYICDVASTDLVCITSEFFVCRDNVAYAATYQQLFCTVQNGAIDGTGLTQYGSAVDTSGDIVISADTSGTAYVHRWSGSAWNSDSFFAVAGEGYGADVGIDGTKAVVGASLFSASIGRAYFYEYGGSAWAADATTATVTASGGSTGDLFGASVGISGSAAVIGAPGADSSIGEIYIFEQSSGWIEQNVFLETDSAAGNNFGQAVDIDGSIIVAGAPGNGDGVVSFFEKTAGSWSRTTLVTSSDPSGSGTDQFGASVSLSGDYAAIGAPGHSSGKGKAYIFVRISSVRWIQSADLETSSTTLPAYGTSVGLDAAAGHVVVGAPDDTSGSDTGFVDLWSLAYDSSGGVTASLVKTLAADTPVALYGTAVSVSGEVIAIGSPQSSTNGQVFLETFCECEADVA